jgi:hypothetical protein
MCFENMSAHAFFLKNATRKAIQKKIKNSSRILGAMVKTLLSFVFDAKLQFCQQAFILPT